MQIIFDAPAITSALDNVAEHIAKQQSNTQPIYLIGIHRGGVHVAHAIGLRLQKRGFQIIEGSLDISFYRDDLDSAGRNPEIHSSDLPMDLQHQPVWLIDDVLFSGRTIRAALGELFDYCRPASVRLAVLLDRSGRELPIQADVAGLQHPNIDPHSSIKLITDEDDAWKMVQIRRH